MTHIFSLALTLTTPALADSGAAETPQVETTADAWSEPTKIDPERNRPIYVLARGSVAVPANAQGQIPAGGLGMGVELDNGHTFGFRAIYLDNPPPNPFVDDQREVRAAWGPVLDYQFHLSDDRNLNFYPALSLGFVYAAERGEENVILPIFEAGFGARLVRETKTGDRFFIEPEIGVVPGAMAPYASLSVGSIFGTRDRS
jgi:hypothetical protein